MNAQPTHSFQLGPVEQGVPMPDKMRALAAAKERAQQLNIGDSFEFRVLPIKDPAGITYRHHGGYSFSRGAFVNLQTWARQRGIKLTARWLEGDSDIQVARIWRVA